MDPPPGDSGSRPGRTRRGKWWILLPGDNIPLYFFVGSWLGGLVGDGKDGVGEDTVTEGRDDEGRRWAALGAAACAAVSQMKESAPALASRLRRTCRLAPS